MSDQPDRDGAWLIRVDTGGTFTDGWACDPAGREVRCKILSSGVLRTRVERRLDERRFEVASDFGAADGVLVGFRAENAGRVAAWQGVERIVEFERECVMESGDLLELTSGEEAPVVAARLMTATPLGGCFPLLDFRLATTRGTNALLERKGVEGVLFVTEGFEDLLRIRDQRRPHLFDLEQHLPEPVFSRTIGVSGRISNAGEILQGLDEDALEARIGELVREGVSVVAVALLNSYANPAHEERLGALLAAAGITHISLSTALTRRHRLLPRSETAAANAYLSPVMEHFIGAVQSRLEGGNLDLMTSAGYLKRAAEYRPIDSLLSGPAGGVVGALAAAESAGSTRVLAFDMGGTSTDVARLEGAPSFRYEQAIGPVRVVAPAVKIETVAAGGGSICHWSNGGLEVGPESAGADPGPACYGRGGPLTITDVNLLLECMDPARAGLPLDVSASRRRLEELKERMEGDGVSPGEDQALLEGLREIAVERMADAIRKISLREGYHPREYVLVAFGGAGPQHACAVAEKLGVREILVPGDAGLLSAWGLHRAGPEKMAERQVMRPIEELRAGWIGKLESLEAEARSGLGAGARGARYLFEVRLMGQDSSLELEAESTLDLDELRALFSSKYRALYGYPIPPGRQVELVAIRVIARLEVEKLASEDFVAMKSSQGREVLQDRFRTCVLEAGWKCLQGSRGSLRLVWQGEQLEEASWTREVESELFRCRFESVVEEMGELLRRTAISTNVKERLDFSCALLDAEGRLVVNAPHIPVHLGALGECVRQVSAQRRWRDGDMVVVNHPGFGGSHLPDVTVVSPIFLGGQLQGFVANRAHHAEIGGRTPGSMPANARSLDEEGVVIAPTLLFDAGEECFAAVEEIFRRATYPSRQLTDNMADLSAQAAANRHGVSGVQTLLRQYGADAVGENMERLRKRAAFVISARLAAHEGGVWQAEDVLDDGTRIAVTLGCTDGQLRICFESGGVHPGNLNATPAIVRSAVLYVLRAWVSEDLPLNEGLLDHVAITVPPGLLSPRFPKDASSCPAVVGGNVETSQRVVDVLLSALGLQANSQGTMNNFLFGNEQFGYYETIGGGSGAGPHWHGMSGTHVHMSNTAITDPEVLERRFPIRLHEFSLRRGSGGQGQWLGGDGLVREVEFLERMTVSFLSQRRSTPPRGAHGGADGSPGVQTRMASDGKFEVLPAVCSLEVQAGDRIRIETPGGGGWGKGET